MTDPRISAPPPLCPEADRLPELALAWHRAGRGAALATVVETWGSAPRPAGSQLVVAGDGAMMGSVSGGCVEGAVVHAAQAALAAGQGRLLQFGVSDDDAFAVGLACGGQIRVLVQPVGTQTLPEPLLADLVAMRAARQAAALLVDLGSLASRLVSAAQATGALADRFRSDRSGTDPGSTLFAGLHNPPLRLLVVGAVHVAQALLPMARIAGFEPRLIDPRSAFGSAARFPGEVILDDWPDAALARLAPMPAPRW
ncbi:XdhC/CoxI family protein [Frigidibacter mobilis]|uniref:XdhC/CoxI family protein n=1 Tax=Frigidibacter mobilis TaxID=1335048 RepID=A0A159Z4U6_9RHOB|nr:XdhC/CoxI family protein [Frigidibacter mobilis]